MRQSSVVRGFWKQAFGRGKRGVHGLALSLSVLSLSFSMPMGSLLVWADPAPVQAAVQAVGQAYGQAAEPIHITLLQLNDVYQIAPEKPTELGGFARIATLKKKIQAENPNTLLILAGDTLSPSPGAQRFQGKQMVDLWNQAGLDLATLGNHEFDFGDAVLCQRLAESKFHWVISNVEDKSTHQSYAGLPKVWIQEMNGVKVGFFGLLTPETMNVSNVGTNVQIKDPVYTACEMVNQLRHQGAEVIVAITHLSMPDDKRVAQNMNHALALIMGGHEHSVLQSVAGGIPIYKVGSDARLMGRYDLWLDPASHRLLSMDAQFIPVNQDIPDDPAVQASVNTYLNEINAGLSEVIGKSTVPLNALQADNRSRETNLGDFIADSYRDYFKADAALLNSGSIRSNQVYPAGEITRQNIHNILQFSGPVLKVSVTGEQLKSALENGFSQLGQESGRFPQVSGLQVTYDPKQAVGARVQSLLIAGKPVQPKATYTLAVPAYLVLKGGDDYTMLKTAKILNDAQEAPSDVEIVETRIQQFKTISPLEEGRIRAVGTLNNRI